MIPPEVQRWGLTFKHENSGIWTDRSSRLNNYILISLIKKKIQLAFVISQILVPTIKLG